MVQVKYENNQGDKNNYFTYIHPQASTQSWKQVQILALIVTMTKASQE